ncbi:MAG: single-stranded DNA-binding protein [Selenomonadaceae bacterium]|nr:single-stranded DNA-binding protein [Selenomonadaceae bacterium]MBQ3433719.1 single-stranded DNA-binding protein [Selenomonadaceae bacterium]
MNKVFLSGNLTRDIELKQTTSGKSYARIGIAVKRPFSKDKDAVDFLNLVVWEKTAEFMNKYMGKGSRVLVEGRIQTGSYEKDGTKFNTFDIVVDNVEFAGGDKRNFGGSKPRDDFEGEDLPPGFDSPF